MNVARQPWKMQGSLCAVFFVCFFFLPVSAEDTPLQADEHPYAGVFRDRFSKYLADGEASTLTYTCWVDAVETSGGIDVPFPEQVRRQFIVGRCVELGWSYDACYWGYADGVGTSGEFTQVLRRRNGRVAFRRCRRGTEPVFGDVTDETRPELFRHQRFNHPFFFPAGDSSALRKGRVDETYLGNLLLVTAVPQDITFERNTGDMIVQLHLGETPPLGIVELRLSKDDDFYPVMVSYSLKLSGRNPILLSRAVTEWDEKNGARLPKHIEYFFSSPRGRLTRDAEYRFDWRLDKDSVQKIRQSQDNDWMPQFAEVFQRKPIECMRFRF